MRFFLAVLLLSLASCAEKSADKGAIEAAAADHEYEGLEDGDPVYCRAVRAQTTVGQCKLVEQQLSDLKEGIGTIEHPPKMRRDEARSISLSIDPAAAPAAGASPVQEAQTSESAEQFSIKIGRVMSAELIGDGFEISPAGEQVRDLGAGNRARWNWTVVPKREGVQELQAIVNVKALGPDGKPTQLDLFEDHVEIKVEVTWTQRAHDMASSLKGLFNSVEGTLVALAALLVAMVAVVGAFRKLRRGSAGNVASGGVDEGQS